MGARGKRIGEIAMKGGKERGGNWNGRKGSSKA